MREPTVEAVGFYFLKPCYNEAMPALLIPQYIIWHFVKAPKEILQAWKNILWFNLNFFSVTLLLKTLFSPWKGIQWQRKRAFEITDLLYVISSNLISRILGAIVRIPLLIIGTIGEMIIIIAGFFVLVCWFLLPVFIMFGSIYGFALLF